MESGWTNKENQYYYDRGEKKTGWLHTDYWYYLDRRWKNGDRVSFCEINNITLINQGPCKQDGSKQMEHTIMQIIVDIFKKVGCIKGLGII